MCLCGLGIPLCRSIHPMDTLWTTLRRTKAASTNHQLPIITASLANQWPARHCHAKVTNQQLRIVTARLDNQRPVRHYQVKEGEQYTNRNQETRRKCCQSCSATPVRHRNWFTGGQSTCLTRRQANPVRLRPRIWLRGGQANRSIKEGQLLSNSDVSIFSAKKSSSFTPNPSSKVSVSTRNPSVLTRSPSALTRNLSVLTRNPSLLTRNSSTSTNILSILTRSPSVSTRSPSVFTRSSSFLTRSPSIFTTTTSPYSTSKSSLKLISKEEAAQLTKPNSVVFVEGVVGTPKILMNAMYEHVKSNNIQGVTVLDVFSLYPYENMADEDCVRRLSFFVSPHTRKFVNKGKAEYIPIMLNDLPMVFDCGYYSPDVALISVSPPDASGYVSLGTNVTELHSVIQSSKLVVAQINDKMPRSLGDALLRVDQIDYGVEVSYDLFEPASEPVTDVDTTIANLICDQLIEDEATLQIGLGKIPEAILNNIKSHKNLGVHTELLTPGVLGLVKAGIVNNSKKSIDRDQITATLLLGDRALYEFVNDNELVQMKRVTYSNNPAIIRQNHRMTAINTCLEIDLTGQVVSDSLGTKIYSGFGGQVDFMRGALTGLDGRGKAILAFASTDEKSGESKIVPMLKPGAGVVCSRAHVNYIVTEYGIANLFAKTTRQRAHQLIALAHPRHRETLEREAFEILGVMPCA